MPRRLKRKNTTRNMDDKNTFDAQAYFKNLTERNKLAMQYGFYPCACSGINSLEDMLLNFQSKGAFVSVDDTNDSQISRQGAGFFAKRTITVFVLRRYKFGDMTSRKEALDVCRRLYRQFVSRLLVDSARIENDFTYLNTDRIFYRELGEYYLNGLTGLYFMIDVNEPEDLRYDAAEWTE